MCGRYRRTTQEEELARLYHIPISKQTDLPISFCKQCRQGQGRSAVKRLCEDFVRIVLVGLFR